MTRTPRILFALSLVLACEEGSGSTTDTGSTSSSPTDPTLGDTVSEPSTSTTGPADPTTSGTTGDASTSTTGTTGEPACGAAPAAECAPAARTWCEDLAVLCQETGLDLSPNGTNYCAVVATMCAENVPPCQVCAYLESTCTQLGIVGACVDLNAECLCRAAAHDL